MHLVQRSLGNAPIEEYWIDPAHRYVRHAYDLDAPLTDDSIPYPRSGQYAFPRTRQTCVVVFVRDGQAAAPLPSACPRPDLPVAPRALASFLRRAFRRTRASMPNELRGRNVVPYIGPDAANMAFSWDTYSVWWLKRGTRIPIALQRGDPEHRTLAYARLDVVPAGRLPGYFFAPYGPSTLERIAVDLRLLPAQP